MARSTYIYIVLKDMFPKASFTVKHEMITWWKKHYMQGLSIIRMRDGKAGFMYMDPQEF